MEIGRGHNLGSVSFAKIEHYLLIFTTEFANGMRRSLTDTVSSGHKLYSRDAIATVAGSGSTPNSLRHAHIVVAHVAKGVRSSSMSTTSVVDALREAMNTLTWAQQPRSPTMTWIPLHLKWRLGDVKFMKVCTQP